MVSPFHRKSAPVFSRWAPRCSTRLSAISTRSFVRAVGDEENRPNEATPEMVTAGPISSLGGADSASRVYCARVS